MNEKGFVPPMILLIVGAFLIVLIIPPILLTLFPFVRLIFQIAMIFMIYIMVKGYIGDGPLTLIISGILIYFLVFKYTLLTSTLWVFQTLLMYSFFSMVIWGVGTQTPRFFQKRA